MRAFRCRLWTHTRQSPNERTRTCTSPRKRRWTRTATGGRGGLKSGSGLLANQPDDRLVYAFTSQPTGDSEWLRKMTEEERQSGAGPGGPGKAPARRHLQR
jgi:hypothetical protein